MIDLHTHNSIHQSLIFRPFSFNPRFESGELLQAFLLGSILDVTPLFLRFELEQKAFGVGRTDDLSGECVGQAREIVCVDVTEKVELSGRGWLGPR